MSMVETTIVRPHDPHHPHELHHLPVQPPVTDYAHHQQHPDVHHHQGRRDSIGSADTSVLIRQSPPILVTPATALKSMEKAKVTRKQACMEGVLRYFLLFAFVFAFWGIARGLESWKEDKAGGLRRFSDAGFAISILPGQPVRDYSHIGFDDALSYLLRKDNRVDICEIVRDVACGILGLALLYPVWVDRRIGWRVIGELISIVVLRTICDAIVWEAIPVFSPRTDSGDIAPTLSYFFSGHAAYAVITGWEVFRYYSGRLSGYGAGYGSGAGPISGAGMGAGGASGARSSAIDIAVVDAGRSSMSAPPQPILPYSLPLPLPLPLRRRRAGLVFALGFTCFVFVFYICIIQLIMRVAYFADVYAGIVSAVMVLFACDYIQTWRLTRRYLKGDRFALDRHHDSEHDQRVSLGLAYDKEVYQANSNVPAAAVAARASGVRSPYARSAPLAAI